MRVCLIGSFDGVHLGHLHSIQQAALYGDVHLLTLDPHPHLLLRGRAPLKLATLEQRLLELKKTAPKSLSILPCTEKLLRRTYEEFLIHLYQSAPFDKIVMGTHSRLGRAQEGSPERVAELGLKLGFEVLQLSPLLYEGLPISSSRIREAIVQGDLNQAEAMLGRPYQVLSSVQIGAGRGKALGSPTVNLSVEGWALPPLGVYAALASVKGNIYPSIVSLGPAPTFGREESLLEVHFLDGTHHETYDQVGVIFKKWIRPLQCFSSPSLLQTQIQHDILRAKEELASYLSD